MQQVVGHIEAKMQISALKPKEDLTKVPTPMDIVRRGNLIPVKFNAPIIEYQRKLKKPEPKPESKNESSLLIDALAYELQSTPNSSQSLPSNDEVVESSKSLSISSIDLNESRPGIKKDKFALLFR